VDSRHDRHVGFLPHGRRTFGADPQVLGRSVELDTTGYTVVGVLPGGFWFPQDADAFLPLRVTGGLNDTGTNTEMIARLKPDVSLRQAQASMGAVTESFRREYPGKVSREYRGLAAVPFQDYMVGDVRLTILLLFGAVGLLLLIACSNLASLLLARLAGCLAGLFVAYWLLAGLLGVVPFHLPASAPIHLDARVLLFTLAVTAATGLVFTLAPFLSSARLDLHATLKAAGRSEAAGSVRQRTRACLVVGEIALSVPLLISAGLLIQSLYRMHQERLGFRPQGLITFRTPLARDRRRDAAGLFSRNEIEVCPWNVVRASIPCAHCW